MTSGVILRRMALCLCLATAAPFVAMADDDDSSSSSQRLSAQADFKLIKGLHLSAQEEVRFDDFKSFDRSYTTVDLSWKAFRFMKLGASYTFMGVARTDDSDPGSLSMELRHRFSTDVSLSCKLYGFHLSLRERLQATCKTREMNLFQQPRVALALRSRVKVSYPLFFQGFGLEPYLSGELKHDLNGALWQIDGSSPYTSGKYDASFLGYKDAYLARVRGQVGVEAKLSMNSTLDFYVLVDGVSDKEIDSNKSGTRVAPIVMNHSTLLSMGLAYKYSF